MTKKNSEYGILLVDDEIEVLEGFELTLKFEGLDDITLCQDSRKVLPVLKDQSERTGVILLDLIMPHMSGQELLIRLSEEYPEIPVIVITATHEIEMAVLSMQHGAFDYLAKPVEKMRLLSSVRRAIEKRTITRENQTLKRSLLSEELATPKAFEAIISQHPKMLSIFRYCEAISSSTEPVLITGETGVGKELIARSLHSISGLTGDFVGINIAGLDEHGFSDAIFGHRKGAFTGADTPRDGLLKKAQNGTLFLDEIGDLSPPLQIKLLRLLQENEYFPLGSDTPEEATARIIAATNTAIGGDSGDNLFRKDLFYRLQTHQINIPPLRQRLSDLPLLADHFIANASRKLNKPRPNYPDALTPLLECYDFPRNIRELKAMIFDGVTRAENRRLLLDSFKSCIFKDRTHRVDFAEDSSSVTTIFQSFEQLPTIEKASQHLITEAMARTNCNQSLASRILGISQSALSQRLKRLKDKRS